MLFTIAVILLVFVVARAGERIHARQLHLRPAGDRPGAVRGGSRQRPSDGLTMLEGPSGGGGATTSNPTR